MVELTGSPTGQRQRDKLILNITFESMLLKTFFREFSLQQEILEMWASTIETHFLRSKFNIFFPKSRFVKYCFNFTMCGLCSYLARLSSMKIR